MNFLFPTFLVGLAAIAIPIIIHLFNFRKYKKMYFTNVQFLKELKQESDSKSKLKEWLILLMRVLAIASLVFAFAQPIIPGKSKQAKGEKAISIYIDNSFSMENVNKKGTLLENAKLFATEIINSFDASDKFQLITNNFEGRHQRFLSKEEFIEQLDEVKISSASQNINDVVKRQQDFLQNSSIRNKQIFLLSDFQTNKSFFNKADLDTAIAVNLIPIISSEVNNIYIDSVWFESPVQQFGSQQIIHATIINNSSREIENMSLKLFLNNAQVSLNSFNLSANDKRDVSISFLVKEKGVNNGILKIEDYPITFDDDFYFSFNSKTSVYALVVNGKETKTSGNFKSLMQHDSLFIYKEMNELAIDYSEFSNANIIILNELSAFSSGLTSELQKFLSNGGTLVIFPNKKLDINSYNNAFLSLKLPQVTAEDTAINKIQTINFEQGLYEGVFDKIDQRMDLPKVFFHYQFMNSTRSNAQVILSLQNKDALLSLSSMGNGKAYVFSIPSDESCSNLLKHSLFVPTILKMSILSVKPFPLYYKTAINEAISLRSTYNFTSKPLHIIKSDKKVDVIPEHRSFNQKTILYTQNQINEAGHYIAAQSTQTISGLAFNFDRKESDMNFLSKNDLQKEIDEKKLTNVFVLESGEKQLTDMLQEVNDGKKLWKLFLVLALIFLLLESLIIRLFR
jgi:hypothetical protein